VCSTHVDDIFALCNEAGRAERSQLLEAFRARVEIDNLGPVSWALKTQVLRDAQAGILKISQERYVNETLELHYPKMLTMTGAAQRTPYYVKLPEDGDETPREDLKKSMQSKIGALWWIAQISRPDIIMPLHWCSKEINKPTQGLSKRVECIFRYLSSTKDLGIVYKRPTLDTPVLSAYVDASFAGEAESASRIAYLYLFQGNLVSWTSDNPRRVMTSSTEAECYGLYEVARENVWQRQMQEELPFYNKIPATSVYEDNQSTMALLKNDGPVHKRVKHYGVNWSYVKECKSRGELTVSYVPTEEQAADFMTKTMTGPKFKTHRKTVMGDDEAQNFFNA